MTEQVHLIMQQHLNGGGRLFGGALMQWLDEVAEWWPCGMRKPIVW